MNRSFLLGAFVTGSIVLASQASAAVLIEEHFDYTAGQPLLGQSNTFTGNNWRRAGTQTTATAINTASGNLTPPAPLQPATGGSLAITGIGNASGMATRLAFLGDVGVTATSGTGELYYSLMVRIDALTGSNPTTGGFMLSFNNTSDADTTTSVTTAAARLQSRIDPTNAAKFNLGIFNGNATAGAASWSGPLDVGTQYFIVARYDWEPLAGDDIVSLWINPGSLGAGTAPAPNFTAIGSDVATLSSIIMRQSPAPHLTLDELRVGETWAQVTVPEPMSLSLLGLGTTGLLARRRRA